MRTTMLSVIRPSTWSTSSTVLRLLHLPSAAHGRRSKVTKNKFRSQETNKEGNIPRKELNIKYRRGTNQLEFCSDNRYIQDTYVGHDGDTSGAQYAWDRAKCQGAPECPLANRDFSMDLQLFCWRLLNVIGSESQTPMINEVTWGWSRLFPVYYAVFFSHLFRLQAEQVLRHQRPQAQGRVLHSLKLMH